MGTGGLPRLGAMLLLPLALLLLVPADGEGPGAGREARRGEFPFQVSVQGRLRAGGFAHLCGGALLSPSHVVTAALCLHGKGPGDLRVVAGIERIFGGGPERAERPVAAVRPHEQFSQDDLTDNIALIRVEPPFPEDSEAVRPVTLAGSDSAGPAACSLAGWTVTYKEEPPSVEVLRAVGAGPEEPAACRARLRRVGLPHTPATLCARLAAGAAGRVCTVEPGSPLLCGGRLLGLVSSGDACAAGDAVPLLLTRVSAYAGWLAAAMAR